MAAAPEVSLLGMGNPLLDISATVDTALLKKYKLEENLAILAEKEHLPLYPELEADHKVSYVAGGATQNSCRVAQWMLGSTAKSAFIGCTGNDAYADRLQAYNEKYGVKTAYLRDETTPTGTCAVLVTGKHRTLVANISAANNYKIEHLSKPEIWSIVEQAKIFYISGFFLTVSPPSILKIAEHSASANKIFAMNLAAPFICQFFGEPLAQCLLYCDFVFGNETEAEAFATANKFGTTDLKEIAKKIADLPKKGDRKRTVVITHGSEPTIVLHEGEIVEYPVDVIAEDKIVDTNGAGDAFVGGFLAELVRGKGMKECVAAGQWAAKVIIQQEGCTYPDACEFGQ